MNKSKFKKGMIVQRAILAPFGEVESDAKIVHSVHNGVVYLEDSEGEAETGITYDAETGKEIECFFDGFNSSIYPMKAKVAQ